MARFLLLTLLFGAAAASAAVRAAELSNDGDDDSDVSTLVVESNGEEVGDLFVTASSLAFKLGAASTWSVPDINHLGAVDLHDSDYLPAGLLQDVKFVGANGAVATVADGEDDRQLCPNPAGGVGKKKHDDKTKVVIGSNESNEPLIDQFQQVGAGGMLVLRFVRPIRAVIVHLTEFDDDATGLLSFVPGRNGHVGKGTTAEVDSTQHQYAVVVTDGGGFDSLAIAHANQASASGAGGFCLVKVSYPSEQEFENFRKRHALQDDDDGDDDDDTPTIAVDEEDDSVGIEDLELNSFQRTTEPACQFDIRKLPGGTDVRDQLPTMGIRALQFHGVFAAESADPPDPPSPQRFSLLCPREGVDQQAVVEADALHTDFTQYSEPLTDERFMFVASFKKKLRSVTFTLCEVDDGDQFTVIPGSNGEEGNGVLTELVDGSDDDCLLLTVVAVDGQGFDELAIVPVTDVGSFCVANVALPCESLFELYDGRVSDGSANIELDNDDDIADNDGDYNDDSFDSDDDDKEDDDDANDEPSGEGERQARAARRKERQPL